MGGAGGTLSISKTPGKNRTSTQQVSELKRVYYHFHESLLLILEPLVNISTASRFKYFYDTIMSKCF